MSTTWLCSKDFELYASTCFEAFGDRVKYWVTFNEPRGFSIQGYDSGVQAPGRCSFFIHLLCKEGKSSDEPYVVAHNILLSHAAVYHTYQKKYKVLSHPKKQYKMVVYLISLILKGNLQYVRKYKEDQLGLHWMPNGSSQ